MFLTENNLDPGVSGLIFNCRLVPGPPNIYQKLIHICMCFVLQLTVFSVVWVFFLILINIGQIDQTTRFHCNSFGENVV